MFNILLREKIEIHKAEELRMGLISDFIIF